MKILLPVPSAILVHTKTLPTSSHALTVLSGHTWKATILEALRKTIASLVKLGHLVIFQEQRSVFPAFLVLLNLIQDLMLARLVL